MSAMGELSTTPHLSILASAGAGKTYALTSRYLALLAAEAPIGSVLASTFTRAAAGEIRDRILLRLADAADDPEARHQLARAIQADRLDRADVLRMLRTIARGLHRTQIRTLDSFFGSIVRCFGLELGVPPGSEVLDDAPAQAMRAESMRLMLDERDPQKLINLLRLITQGTSERSVMRAIDDVVANLHETYREADAAAWECVPRRPELSAVEVVEAIQRLESAPLPKNKHFTNAWGKDREQAVSRDWESFLDKGLAGCVAEGTPTYYSKPLDESLIAAYQPLVDHAKAVLVNRWRDQTLATRELLEYYDACYERVRRRRRAMTFADVTRAVSNAERLGRFDEICFRLDASIGHLLLDEFQDTSIPQWRVLEPIARELVSHRDGARTFFCVGDVKQSIYGWRDACPEVLGEIPNLLRGPDGESAVAVDRLSRSWRSSPTIIEVINEVFGSVTANPALAEYVDAAEQFADGFEPHETAREDLPGYVALRTTPRAGEGEERNLLRLRAAAELVADLHRRAPHRAIGVLTRSNKAVARLLYEFSAARLDLPASGRGGGPLTDSPAVNAILDLLRLADHPDDTVAAFNVARGPLGEALDFTDESAASRRRGLARHVRRMLLDRGYAGAIASWVGSTASSCDERQSRRLMQLVDLAALHDTAPTLRADDFIRLAESQAIADETPAPIQVMTIHQSKGLEFDIVVLPELEWRLTGEGTPEVAVERDGPTGPVRRACRWVNERIRSYEPSLEPVFEAHRTRTVRESLSVLYVAMTRAEQGLFMLIDPALERERTLPKTAAGLLRCALANTDAGPDDEDACLYERGDDAWLDARPERATEASGEVPESTAPPELAAPTGRAVRGIAAAPASAHDEAVRPLRESLRLEDPEPLDRGAVIHALFEEIEWIEEFTPREERLLSIVRRLAPRRDDAWQHGVVGMFLEMIERPDVRAALSRGDRPPGMLRVWRERPFVRLVDGRAQSGFIDRLVAEQDDTGRAVRAELIDFKTDDVDGEAIRDRAEGYRNQLLAYRDVARRILRLEPDAIRMTLLFVRPGVVVTLDDRN